MTTESVSISNTADISDLVKELEKLPGLTKEEAKKLRDDIGASWFTDNKHVEDYLYLEAFGWHWHNSSHKHLPIVEGSKFDTLRKITNMKLEERGIEHE